MADTKNLAHTRWNCKYHIVFAPNIAAKFSWRKEKGYRGNSPKAV